MKSTLLTNRFRRVGCYSKCSLSIQSEDDLKMDDTILRILISTDNHLGYLEKDNIRGNDSFAAFEEVLAQGKQHQVDFILLAGDLFHENKPSRSTLYHTFKLCHQYCLGDNPIYLEILNEQDELVHTLNKRMNFESSTHAVDLPIFAIHGNHDDPTRDCHDQNLAALDLFSISNFVNYFGKCNEVDNIEITPILIKKNDCYIALYGLGAIRDERLNRMWNQKKVKFIRPTEEQGKDLFFNIFVLHQNRDYGRGAKNCIHESMIPEWMDVVIWGNEHECQPRLNESLVGTFRIYQPGSSIATSLVEGESVLMPKHMGLLEVKGKQFRLNPIRFQQNRIFMYGELSLANVEGLQVNDPKVEEKIHGALTKKVEDMIREGQKIRQELGSAQTSSIYSIRSPDQILVRLKVDHAGFATINQNRFGANFVGKVANPSEILLFTKKKKENLRAVEGKADAESFRAIIDDDDDDEGNNKIRIDDLVFEALRNSKKPLNILVESGLTQALNDFILKKDSAAIPDFIEDALTDTRKVLFGESNADSRDKIVQMVSRHKKSIEESGNAASSGSHRVHRVAVDDEEEGDMVDGGSSEEEPPAKKAGRAKSAPKANKTSAKGNNTKKSTAVAARPARSTRKAAPAKVVIVICMILSH